MCDSGARHAVALREGGHRGCSFLSGALRPQSRIESRYFLSLPALQSRAGREPVGSRDEFNLSKMRATNSCPAAGRTKRGRGCLHRRNSGQAEIERIATGRDCRLHQSADDPTPSLATAFADLGRTESAARKRTRATVTLHPVARCARILSSRTNVRDLPQTLTVTLSTLRDPISHCEIPRVRSE